jgi:hypothetical protein
MTPIETDIVGGNYVVQIGGMQLVGRVSTGQAVVERLVNGSGPVHVVIQTAQSRAVVLGRVLTALGLAVLAAALGFTAIRAVTQRRRVGPSPALSGLFDQRVH